MNVSRRKFRLIILVNCNSSSSPVCSSRVSEFAKISGEVGEERNVKCQLLSVALRRGTVVVYCSAVRWIRNVSRRDLTDGLTSASAAYRVWFGFRHRGISINEQSQRLCCASDIAAAGQNYLVPIAHNCCVLNPLAISLHLALCLNLMLSSCSCGWGQWTILVLCA